MTVARALRWAQRPSPLPPAGIVWRAGAVVVALAVVAPVLWLGAVALQAGGGHWRHLAEHVLPAALGNTSLLLAGVGLWVALVGSGAAWLVAAYEFPLRRLLQWALLLPLAMPTYIVAYVYLDMLHPIGAVQGAVRALLGYDSPRQFRLPDLRSMGGAVFVLGSVLYPYVYMTMRAMFATQAAVLIEAARTLGYSRRRAWLHVTVPMARPALAVGLSLALLETLNDIGASEFLGVPTLTVAVYTTWITRSDLGAAAQIACAMLAFVVGLIALERYGRRRRRYGAVARMRPMTPVRLRGAAAWAVTSACALPVLLGFVAPAAYLAVEAARRLHDGAPVSKALYAGLANTLGVALVVTLLTLLTGLLVAWASRRTSGRQGNLNLAARTASLGYAVPGTVLAIGLLPPALALDGALAQALELPGLPLMGVGAVLILACTMRFLAIAVGGIEAGLERIPLQIEQASRSLGHTAWSTLRRVHLPLLRPALGVSALLVFVDAMKELPATLLLRPANFETLATLLYGEAARGTYEEGALAALAIVAAGVLPIAALARMLPAMSSTSAPSPR